MLIRIREIINGGKDNLNVKLGKELDLVMQENIKLKEEVKILK